MIAQLTFANVAVDLLSARARIADIDISLRFKEYKLLLRLLRDAPQPVSTWDLWIDVLGRPLQQDPDFYTNALPVHISRLRDQLRDRSLIATLPWGYAIPHEPRLVVGLG